jgi:hypothetical protein
VLAGVGRPIECIAFAQNGILLCAEKTPQAHAPCTVYGCADWRSDTWQRLGEHPGSVDTLTAIGESRVLSAGPDGAAAWDLQGWGMIVSRRATYLLRTTCVSPDARWAALLQRGSVVLLALPDLNECDRQPCELCRAAFSPDRDELIAGGFDGDVITFRIEAGLSDSADGPRLVRNEVLTHHEGSIVGLGLLCKHSILVTAESGGCVRFTGRDHSTIEDVQSPFEWVSSLQLSPDESFMIAVSGTEDSFALWDLGGFDLAETFQVPFARATTSILPQIKTMLDDMALSPRSRLALEYAECVLQRRFRFDIELGAAPAIMVGEFDIEIEG